MMQRLRDTNDFTVVDLWPHFNDVSLALLDMSDVILTILTLEITNIKNIRLFLEVAEQLGYGDRLKLVLNRADSAFGIRVADVESSVGRKIDHQVVSDGRTVVYALNRGVPFVWSNSQAPGQRGHPQDLAGPRGRGRRGRGRGRAGEGPGSPSSDGADVVMESSLGRCRHVTAEAHRERQARPGSPGRHAAAGARPVPRLPPPGGPAAARRALTSRRRRRCHRG